MPLCDLAAPARGGHRATPLPPRRLITDRVARPPRPPSTLLSLFRRPPSLKKGTWRREV